MSDGTRLQTPLPRALSASLWTLLAVLLAMCVLVLRPFLVPLLWAAIVSYTSWPLYCRVRRRCQGRDAVATVLMTTGVSLALIVPMVWLVMLLTDEVARAYQGLMAYQAAGTMELPSFISELPWLGELIQQSFDRYLADPLLVRTLLMDWAQRLHVELLAIASGIGGNAINFVLMILCLFFLYRDGDAMASRMARLVERFFGQRLARYENAAGAMLKSAIFGLLVTAMVQGAIAGVGFAVFQVEAPVLLGVLTALASIVPLVGTFLTWGSASLWLVASGHLWTGLGLFAWGLCLVNPADNILRPLLISSATRLPFLLVMFGIVGGLAAFGLVGLIIGPVVLAMATAVWHEWTD